MKNEFLIRDLTRSQSDQIFNLEKLDLPYISNEIFQTFALSRQYLFIANKRNEFFRYNFDDETTLKNSYIIPTAERVQINKIFCDPKGNHLIIFLASQTQRITFYFNNKTQKIKELVKLRDIYIETITFDEIRSSELNTDQFLIGCDNGVLYVHQIEYDLKKDIIIEKQSILHNLKSRIHGIFFETMELKNNEQGRYVCVTTLTHFYQFVGPLNFENLFKNYIREPKYFDLSYNIFPKGELDSFSNLQMLYVKDRLNSFVWMSGPGICFGNFLNDPKKIIVKNFNIIPYVKLGRDMNNIIFNETPFSIAHSEFHYYLLFSDSIVVLSKITNNIVHTENIYKGNINNMVYDKYKNCLWLFSPNGVYKFSIEKEEREIWKSYLEKGDFEMALKNSEKSNRNIYRNISKLYADYLYSQKFYMESVNLYAESNERFEIVLIKLLMENQYVPLTKYLEKIEKLFNTEDKTQLVMINTLLLELILLRINEEEDKVKLRNLNQELTILTEQKEKFLDDNTVYQLFQNSGKISEFISFAFLKEDYEKVIVHYVNDKQIKEAVELMRGYGKNESKKDEMYSLFTRYSNVFMIYEPESTIDMLLENFKNNIESNKIIFAIMNTDKKKRDKVIVYLGKMVKDPNCTDRNVHKLFLFFLCQNAEKNENSIEEILMYLEESYEHENSFLDIDYTLKVLSQFKIYKAQAYALFIMEKYDEAIKISLKYNHLDIAKKIAKDCKNSKVKKRLWIEIFIYITKNKKDINEAIKILNESDSLNIEDVLPYMMDNIKIEYFRSQLDDCIKRYEEENTQIKTEITIYNQSSENIKLDIARIPKKHMELRYRDCVCSICNERVKEDEVYIFPCRHIFDDKCIIKMLKNYNINITSLSPKIETILVLREEINDMERRKVGGSISVKSDSNETPGGFFSIFKANANSKKEIRQGFSGDDFRKLDFMKKQLAELLTEECVLCGEHMIMNIKFKFEKDEVDKSSWMIY